MQKSRKNAHFVFSLCTNRFADYTKGVSQETVYEDTGLHIGRIETERHNITVSTLSRLCDYYGITLSEFFEGIKVPE